jgi:hypothetical protein
MQNKALEESTRARRRLLETSALAGVVLLGCAGNASPARAPNSEGGEKGEAEVTPGEDLMQEHGVLERILLIYDESARRI